MSRMSHSNFFSYLMLLGFLTVMQHNNANAQPPDYLTPPVNSIKIPYVYNGIVKIDGLKDTCYGAENVFSYFFMQAADWTESDLSGSFNMAYDCNNLYVFVDVTDDIAHNITEDYWMSSWEFDNVTLYVDPHIEESENGDYEDDAVELRFNPGYDTAFFFHSNWLDKSVYLGVPPFEENHVFLEKPSGYYFEAAIPWEGLLPKGITSEYIDDFIGNPMGFDIYINDSDDDPGSPGHRETTIFWDDDTAGLGTAYVDVRKFGVMTLDSLPENHRCKCLHVEIVNVTDTIYVYDTVFTSIHTVSAENLFNLTYLDQTNILLQSSLPITKIDIIDMHGKNILSKYIEQKKEYTLSCAHVPVGNYVLKISFNDNMVSTKKIIIR